MYLLAILGGLSLAVQFTIESGAWYFRAQAAREELGRMLSTASQLLYSSRLFAFGFQLVISLMVDTRAGWTVLSESFLIGFVSAALVHLLVYHVPGTARATWRALHAVMPSSIDMRPELRSEPRLKVHDYGLFRRTLFATILFSVAATAPFLLAYRFTNVRMTMGSIAQMMNFLGAITIVSLVEPMLYRAIDAESLEHLVFDYLLGRFWGFVLCAVILVGLRLLW
jgi:hypothetical protein